MHYHKFLLQMVYVQIYSYIFEILDKKTAGSHLFKLENISIVNINNYGYV